MKGLFRYKHLTIIAVCLVLFLFFAVLLSSLFRRNSSVGTVAPTLLPTQFSNRPGGFEGGPLPTLSENELNAASQKTRRFSAKQLERLKRFDSEVPYYSPEFDINYSKVLDQYFVALKTEDAAEKFQEYLRTKGMLDIKNVYRDFFVLGTNPVYEQVKKAEEEYYQKQSTSNE